MPPARLHAGSTFQEAATATLSILHDRVGWTSWSVSRRVGDTYVLLAAVDELDVARPGLAVPWETTLCAEMERRGDGMIVGDLATDAGLAARRDAAGLLSRAYLGVPIRGHDGSLLGTVCAHSVGPQPVGRDGGAGLLELVRVSADMLGYLLDKELTLAGWARRVERLEAEAQADTLTALPTRKAWDAALIAEDKRCGPLGLTAAVVVVEARGLDAVNGQQGRAAGDQVLRTVALVLRACAAESDLVARLGGDAFGVLLAQADEEAIAGLLARIEASPLPTGVTLAVGHAMRSPGGVLIQAWADADAALQAREAPPTTAAVPAPRQPQGVEEDDDEDQMLWILESAARRLDMTVAYVAEIRDGVQTYEHLWSSGPLPVARGDWTTAEDSYCARMLDGRIPCVIRDAREVAEVAHLPATTGGLVGSYVAVPVRLSDGTVYGSLCVFRAEPHESLDDTAEALLRVLAEAAGRIVERRMRSDRREHRTLEAVDAIIAAQGPQMALQPIVDLRRGTVYALEALARFPGSRLPVPEWFRRDAEARGDQRLERAALTSAARTIPMLDEIGPGVRLAVNLSAGALLTPAVRRVLGGLPLGRIIVEITEHEIVDDYASVTAAIEPLRADGMMVAVDDTGAGYASLRHLLHLQPDIVKLDISLVGGVDACPPQQALIEALVRLTRAQGSRLVAEGVETRPERTCLAELGVPLAQGYAIARPTAPDLLLETMHTAGIRTTTSPVTLVR